MVSKVVTVSELSKDNPTLCMSTLRVFGMCHKCKTFKQALYKMQMKYDDPEDAIKAAIESLRCKPRLPDGYIDTYIKAKKMIKDAEKIMKPLS